MRIKNNKVYKGLRKVLVSRICLNRVLGTMIIVPNSFQVSKKGPWADKKEIIEFKEGCTIPVIFNIFLEDSTSVLQSSVSMRFNLFLVTSLHLRVIWDSAGRKIHVAFYNGSVSKKRFWLSFFLIFKFQCWTKLSQCHK